MRAGSNHQHHARLLIRACVGATMAEPWFLWASLGRQYD